MCVPSTMQVLQTTYKLREIISRKIFAHTAFVAYMIPKRLSWYEVDQNIAELFTTSINAVSMDCSKLMHFNNVRMVKNRQDFNFLLKILVRGLRWLYSLCCVIEPSFISHSLNSWAWPFTNWYTKSNFPLRRVYSNFDSLTSFKPGICSVINKLSIRGL